MIRSPPGPTSSQAGASPAAAATAPATTPSPAQLSHPLLAAAALLLLYAVPTCVFLQPLWNRFGDHLVGHGGDPVFNLYVLKWSARQLRLGLPDLWDANFFYPLRGALALSDHLLGPALQLLLLRQLRLVPNAIAGYNLLLASSFVLSGAATAWVLRRSGRSWTAAVLGGGMFAFAPMRWAHLEHLQVLLAQWLPLTLWCWDRLLAERTWRRAAAFLALYLLHLAGGSYLAYMIHLPMLALLVSRAVADRRRTGGDARVPGLFSRRGLWVLAPVALLAAVMVWLLYSPYLTVSRRNGLIRSTQEVALYAATLPSYLAPSDLNLDAGWWHRLAALCRLDLSRDESRLFAGFLATVFAAAGMLAFIRRHRQPPARRPAAWQRAALAALLVLAALSFLAGDWRTLQEEVPDDAWNLPALGFALGLGLWLLARRRWAGNGWLRVAGMDPWERGVALAGLLSFLLSFPIVFVPLRHVVPGLGLLRAPGRFGVITSLAVAVFAAKGLDAWLPAAGARRIWLSVALALALAVDLAPTAVPLRRLPAEPDFPAVYGYLRSAGDVRAVLELPRLKPAHEALYMYLSTLHWRPIANGYSGFLPASDEVLRESVPSLPDAAGFRLLRQLGISHLVVHQAGQEGRRLRPLLPGWEREWLGREVDRVFACDPDADAVYRLRAPER